MTITITCPSCNKTMSVPKSTAGQRGKCSCGNSIIVPGKKVGLKQNGKKLKMSRTGQSRIRKGEVSNRKNHSSNRNNSNPSQNRNGRHSSTTSGGMHILLKVGLGFFIFSLLISFLGYRKVASSASNFVSTSEENTLGIQTGNGDIEFSLDEADEVTLWFVGNQNDYAPKDLSISCTNSNGKPITINKGMTTSFGTSSYMNTSLCQITVPVGSYTLNISNGPDDANYILSTPRFDDFADGTIGIFAGIFYFIIAGLTFMISIILSIIGLVKGRKAKTIKAA